METIETSSARRESFIFYRSFYDAISHCPPDMQSALYRAVASYGLDRIEPDFSDNQMAAAIWTLIRPQLDANYKRYLNGCEGGKFGHLGGAPKGNDNARKDKQPQNNPKTTPNDNVNVNENENAAIAGGEWLLPLLEKYVDYQRDEFNTSLNPRQRAAIASSLRALSGNDPGAAEVIVNTNIIKKWRELRLPGRELEDLNAARAARKTDTPAPGRKRNYLSPDDMDY
ncbi:MAG: hypothetical protein IJ603_06140 [Bacteroidales bacterium]|nr:hypothetical protein [Bacteroidales bacterium]